MATEAKVHVDDVGTVFELDLVDENGDEVDVSTATTAEIVFRKPDDTTVAQTAAFVTNGTDGRLKYESLAGDLDQDGLWAMQAHVVLPTGEWFSEALDFTVEPNL